jgi:phosphoserine aminotransferase
MSGRVINFSAGPAALPLTALERAQAEFLEYPGAGASVMEISHRSKEFLEIHARAKENIKALLNVPEGYHVLFIQGGATMQFSMLALNLLRDSGKPANYLTTGSWGSKAIKEAAKEGEAKELWSGKADNFIRTPNADEYTVDANAAYLHFTSNETIQGVQYQSEPDAGNAPLICDMSSDFLSRPLDISKYALIYAGAQKNIGPAGVAAVIVRDDMLGKAPAGLPSLLDYKVMADGDSLYNTPPSFAVYMIALVTDWLRNDIGGIEKIAGVNEQKAKCLYDQIDGSDGFYIGHAVPECRSRMNVAFRLQDSELDAVFVDEAKAQGLASLKGHRSVGGMRASIYNAMPLEGAQALAAFMEDFKSRKG